jgi:plastocyanin
MKQSLTGRVLCVLGVLLLAAVVTSQSGRADMTWHVQVGAQSKDLGRQALAFLPNEIWIHVNDSITFRSAVDEPHTVTFMTAGQIRPIDFTQFCGGGVPTPPPLTVTGLNCVSTPPLNNGDTFTIQFTATGNFKVVCLLHPDMTGTIHVLSEAAPLPHEQAYYDQQADDQADHVLSEADHDGHSHDGNWQHAASHNITVGDGEILSNAGGKSTAALMRFTDSTMTIHVGDTVEWANHDPATPHTITFGQGEPADPSKLPFPSLDVKYDADGARHAWLTQPGDSTHSGFIAAPPEEVPNSPTPPLAPFNVSRFRVTFKGPGTYPFICALHDGLGMVGQIIVK